MKTIKFLFAVVIAIFACTASATSVDYIFSGTASGSVGGNTFSSSAYEITVHGNLENWFLQSWGGSGFWALSNDTSISIDKVGDFSFAAGKSPLLLSDGNVIGLLGSGFYSSALVGAGLPGGDFRNSLGPIDETIGLAGWNLLSLNTTGGRLIFADGSSSGTFQIVAAPLPAGIWLFVSGLGLVGIAKRRKI
jgi:hypothetical protein